MTQKDSSHKAFAASYQGKALENDGENLKENTAANAAITASNLKDKKICLCEQKH